MGKYNVFLKQKDNRWIESNETNSLVSLDYTPQNTMMDYRDSVIVNIRDIKINLFGWKFNSEILTKRSSNFHDTIQLEFAIRSVSPTGKCAETVFSGNYISHPDEETNSLGASIVTGLYLIAVCGNTEYAKSIYERVLTYPFMPYNPSAFTPTYSRALVALLDSNFMINMLKGSEKMSDNVARNFYEYLVESYNKRLYEFSDYIVKFRANSKLYVG
mgnify:CR=1 FL=1